MTSRKTTDWMWAQASDLLDQAERMHRQLFRLTASDRDCAIWEPPVDVFGDDYELIVIVALPGVPPERIEIASEHGNLLVRAECPIPLTSASRSVWRLEIPYGRFERRIALPAVRFDTARSEFRDGCLIVRLDRALQR
jgi:HSP20 family molecular chaperone IbpA